MALSPPARVFFLLVCRCPSNLAKQPFGKRFLTVKVEWAACESARSQRAVRSSDCPVPQITYSFAPLYCNSPTYSPAFRRRSVQSLITDLLLS
jgi:hypothetical protein